MKKQSNKSIKKHILAGVLTIIVILIMLNLIGKKSYEGKTENLITEFNQGLYQ